MKTLYKNLPSELQLIIYRDLVEVNLGLDYGDANEFSLKECISLLTAWHKTYKRRDSAKSKLLNTVKAMSEGASYNLLKQFTE